MENRTNIHEELKGSKESSKFGSNDQITINFYINNNTNVHIHNYGSNSQPAMAVAFGEGVVLTPFSSLFQTGKIGSVQNGFGNS